MTKLEYTLRNDLLLKILFMKYPDFLKLLASDFLLIPLDDIKDFAMLNVEIPPEVMGDKFCRLDVSMMVNAQLVNLEVQVADEGDFPERAVYYLSREYASALKAGMMYSQLPRTIIICIVAFKLFECPEYHSEFRLLEVTRHTPLTDRAVLAFYELPKVPEEIAVAIRREIWLSLFKANTEEDLAKIEALGVPEMSEMISAYRHVAASSEFRELERLREDARHNEASALGHARSEGRAEGAEAERQKWQYVVADKDAALADKDAALADKDAKIAELLALLGEVDG